MASLYSDMTNSCNVVVRGAHAHARAMGSLLVTCSLGGLELGLVGRVGAHAMSVHCGFSPLHAIRVATCTRAVKYQKGGLNVVMR